MKQQLPLSLQAPENASFDNFIAVGNQQLIFSLRDENESLIFLWGEPGAGKSHLLQALVSQYQLQEKSALYIPLQTTDDWSPDVFDGLEYMDLVCLDELENIVAKADWEEALFHFFNRIRDIGGRLVLAASQSAHNLGINLPDLQSRLSWGVTYQVKALEDEGKIEVLRERAYQRGFEMNREVANYLMNHATRDMTQLVDLLNKLDYATLAEQRKLTIPFIKQFLMD